MRNVKTSDSTSRCQTRPINITPSAAVSANILAVLTIAFLTAAYSSSAESADEALSSKKLSKQQLSKQLKKIIKHADGDGLRAFKLPLSHQLRKIPQDPRNKLTTAKVKLGKFLFHETALGLNPQDPALVETYSCASCHHVAAGFKSGIPQGIGEGGSGFAMSGQSRILGHSDAEGFVADIQPIASPTILNTPFQEPMLWNGSFGNSNGSVNNAVDSTKVNNAGPPGVFVNRFGFAGLESQAIAGTKVHRMRMRDSIIGEKGRYKNLFRQAFPRGVDGLGGFETEVDEVWLGAALAIAAYERTVLANQAPFQKWLRGNRNAMSRQELRGALLFFDKDKGNCVSCHTGPALSSKPGASESEIFFNIGFNDLDTSDARVHGTIDEATMKGRGGFTGLKQDYYKFKIPQLYNLKDSPILGHGASFSTVREVIEYKKEGIPQRANNSNTLSLLFQQGLPLTDSEIDDLVAFVEDALYDKRLSRYVPKRLPSGSCFPVADMQSAIDLGCILE